MNGVEEERDEMSDEEGDDARLASESRTQEQADSKGEREEHEATCRATDGW